MNSTAQNDRVLIGMMDEEHGLTSQWMSSDRAQKIAAANPEIIVFQRFKYDVDPEGLTERQYAIAVGKSVREDADA